MGEITAVSGAILADSVYENLVKDEKIPVLGVTYTVKEFYSDPITDLQMALLQSGNNYVVAFRGTYSWADAGTDFGMFGASFNSYLADQFIPARTMLFQWRDDPKYKLSISNTTIVGHSLGGSLAQYFGAKTGFETLTYNAYGVGHETSGGSNITNYVTMHDPVSSLPRSKMIGNTFMLQDENLYAMGGHGLSNFTSESNWVRGYSRVNAPQDIDVIDGIGSSGLDSAYELALMAIEGRRFAMINGSMDDVILGGEINNVLIGGGGNDTLYGMGGSDVLQGGKGNDTLVGGYSDKDDGVADTLKGGQDFDTYIAGNTDNITDSDGSGAVYLGGEHLDGGDKKVIKHIGVTTTNYTKTFIYCECKTVTKWSDVSTDEWTEEAEEFYLDEATGTKYILSGSTLSVISASGTITINNFSNGQLGIHLGETEKIDKSDVTRDVFLEEDFCSPLILDINNNGTSSTRLGNSNVYFDMDGDGFKERTAWVEQGDGMLVLDRNGNGTIDNGTELFGNFTPLASGNSASDGFEGLLQYDENHDGKIDRNDAAYNQLRVWMDDNQNGITDAGELKTLQEAGVASVKLNPYQTLLSFFDSNADSVLNAQDDVYNYILIRNDDNGGVTLFIPQTDNETAKKLFDNFKGHEIITTSKGTLLINGISFASLENIATQYVACNSTQYQIKKKAA
jgi:hypothetical protein